MWGRGAERPSLPGAPLSRVCTCSPPGSGHSLSWGSRWPHYITAGEITGQGPGLSKSHLVNTNSGAVARDSCHLLPGAASGAFALGEFQRLWEPCARNGGPGRTRARSRVTGSQAASPVLQPGPGAGRAPSWRRAYPVGRLPSPRWAGSPGPPTGSPSPRHFLSCVSLHCPLTQARIHS